MAFWVSAGVHATILLGIVALAGSVAADNRTIRLNGTPAEREAGRDVLLEVLSGAGISLRLTSQGDEQTVGLAWWSPRVGLWLAVDQLPPERAGESLVVTLQVGDGPAERVGRMDIDETGSGRIVSAWSGDYPPAGTPVTLQISEPAALPWSDADTLLSASAPHASS